MKNKKEPNHLYIAIDNYHNEVICVGNKDEVTEALKSHCEHYEYNSEDVSEYISIFKGEEVPFVTSLSIEINF
jgi:hypothetical protein